MNGPADELTVPCEGAGVWPGAAITLWTDDGKRGREGVAIRPTPEGRWVVWLAECGGYPPQMDLLWPCLMCLDLADRPTRLEAMARLAERALPEWGRNEAAHGVTWRGNSERQWLLQPWCAAGVLYEARPGWEDYGNTVREVVPALAGVDPADDIRALAVVLRHVLGVPRWSCACHALSRTRDSV